METMDEKTRWGKMWRTWTLVAAAIALACASFGCEPEMEYADAGEGEKAGEQEGQPSPGEYQTEEAGDVEVTKLELGKSIDNEKSISRATESFFPDETVFVSVHMDGTADDTWLSANWYRNDELIETTQHRSSPNGTEITEMHIGEGPDPLEVGEYRVEVRMNETVVDVLTFEVVPGDE